ncbi:MAG: HAMP domain-containing protein [Deltaproteobacteria bacterium]|nr:HAMP domain-containing protein [Candidatus Anaeroferrophillus wilburensis]MBN2889788.1 HAMP domain-containing protein [Deltaproteobacteria bacterium]
MFNSFASKAIIPVALSLTGFVIVCSLILYSSIREGFLRDAVRQETSLADTVVSSTRYTMMTDDRESLYHIIDSVGAQKGIEHLRIFNKEGVIMFSSDPGELNKVVDKTTAGCIECHSGPEPAERLGSMQLARRFVNGKNNNVLAITAPIYNDAHCSAGDCHFHPDHQKVLGTLDIGLSTASLDSSLLALRLKMVVFCVMVLILSVGGISALLRRNLLAPINNLIDYVRNVSGGSMDNDFPKGISEIETLGQIYHEMAKEKHHAETELIKIRKADSLPKRKGG